MQAAESKYNYENNRELLRIAQGENDLESMSATERLLEVNRGLIRSIAIKFRDRGVDIDDLMQIGTIGMIKAIRSFDLDRGTTFSTYAVPLIFGEIRRHIRDEGPIKIGRYYKKLGAAVMNARNKILIDEGREAHVDELAAICGVSSEEVAVAIDAISPIVSLSDKAYGTDEDGIEVGLTIADTSEESDMDKLSDKIALAEAISLMPQTWQKIVLLRYYRNMTQQQTADFLGLSQVKISREEKKIVEFLREKML